MLLEIMLRNELLDCMIVNLYKFRSSPWRWRHQGPSKHWYPTTTLHGVTTQKTSPWIFTVMKTSNFTSLHISC